jgi:hypothetical protein
MLFADKWIELENFTSSKVSQAHKVKGHIFPFICANLTFKLNVHINTYMTIYVFIYIYNERGNKIAVSV